MKYLLLSMMRTAVNKKGEVTVVAVKGAINYVVLPNEVIPISEVNELVTI